MIYGYVRVSSKGQVDGHGLERQRGVISSFCRQQKLPLESFYSDNGVSGCAENREAINALLLVSQEGDTVVFEKLDRLARDLMVQESLIRQFQEKGIILKSVKDGDDLLDDKPERIMIRQILGAVYQYDKAQIVEKLRLARERIRHDKGKCEGRKSIQEVDPELFDLIKGLFRKPKNGKKLSYGRISEKLNNLGRKTITGQSFTRYNVYQILNS